MATNRVRTANYSAEARARLGEAALKAREALGLSRPQLVAAAAKEGITLNKKSLELVEGGQPGVGQSFLFALGRALPNWDEDTAKTILEGGSAPTTEPKRSSVTSSARQRIIDMSEEEMLQRIAEYAEASSAKEALALLDRMRAIRDEARQRT